MNILVVDDEPVALTSVRRLLKRRGMGSVDLCEDGHTAIERIRRGDYDIILLDIVMPGLGGLEVLRQAKPHAPDTEFIVVSALEDVATSVQAIHLGAYDYLIKPVDPDRLCHVIELALERKGLRAGQAGAVSGRTQQIPDAFAPLVTQNPRMIELLRYTEVMARSGMPILITGESGTGKELLARGVHRAGGNDDHRPFVAVNVTAVPEHLFESAFFGHAAGAFTGATGAHDGHFQSAHGGTLYLDEIGELPLHLQVKFLRVLEEKQITRIGESKARAVDVRIVTSTNADLAEACREGRFRMDLFYRINRGSVHLPPLRDRPGDIALLADHFLKDFAGRHKPAVTGLSSEAMDILMAAPFPGNVRELMSMMENAVLRCTGTMILPEHLTGSAAREPLFSRRLCTLKENADAQIAFVLSHIQGDVKTSARILGISVRQLQRRLATMRDNPRWAGLVPGGGSVEVPNDKSQ